MCIEIDIDYGKDNKTNNKQCRDSSNFFSKHCQIPLK